MFLPAIVSQRYYKCPISAKVFEFRTMRQKSVARKAQQEYTAELIRELDEQLYGDFASGIRRPIIKYAEQYSRRHGPRTATATSNVAVSVSAA